VYNGESPLHHGRSEFDRSRHAVGKGAVNAQIMGIALSRFITGTFIVMAVFLYILMRFSGVTSLSLFVAIAPAATSAASVVAVDRFFGSFGRVTAERTAIDVDPGHPNRWCGRAGCVADAQFAAP
jgi:hypothetical protein